MKTSHKKNRPFDFKLINLVEPYPVLYQRQVGMSTYNNMKTKSEIWKQIAVAMGKDVQFCISRWGNLRCQFTKELRHCRYLCPKMGTLKNSTWPYLDRLKFLENTVQAKRPNRNKIENDKSVHEEEPLWLHLSCDESNSDKTLDSNEEKANFEDCDLRTEPTHEVGKTYEEVKVQAQHTEDRVDNVQKITKLLENMDNANYSRVERRIMAFLCKCQLRALMNEDIGDLNV